MLDSQHAVSFHPYDIVRRRATAWHGIAADIVQVTRHEPFEYRLNAPFHVLILAEQAARHDGETFIEGLPRSRRREFSGKLTFIPAGHEFQGWQEPRLLTRAAYFYIDPASLLADPRLGFAKVDLAPRLFFEEAAIFDTAAKLKALAEQGEAMSASYAEALGAVLAHELVRLDNGPPLAEPAQRGGLAAWQGRAVRQHLEEHLAEPVSLAAMAELAQLSPYHFARAFKQSFGMPPHRYHMKLRIERAKALLAKGDLSVADIAVGVGFSETSAFSASFRKLTGSPPSHYRRSLS